jgi:AraC family transcriptional regulator
MVLVDLDAEIAISNVLTAREVTAFVGTTPCYAREYTLCSPDHYLLGLAITPRPHGAWATYDTVGDKVGMGEVMFFPPGMVQHGSLSPWTGIRKDICCAFPKSRFEKLMTESVEWSEPNLRDSVNLRNPNIRAAIQRIAHEVMQPSLASAVVLDTLASLIAIDLRCHFRRERVLEKPLRCNLSPREMERIDEFVHAHIAQEIYLEDLAGLCELSVRHFSRVFKKATGFTVANYVATKRLEIAKDMLCDAKVPIKRVASRVGFSSVSNFTTAFKRLSGVTPSIFRAHAA